VNSMGHKAIVILGAAAVLAGSGYLLYRARNLSPGHVLLRTYMDDASGLMDGTQVRLNGIPVGYLDVQKFTNSRDPSRKVQFDLKVRSTYLRDIPVDSQVGLASDNLLGDLYIGIRQGKSSRTVEPGAELAAVQAQDITRMMAQMSRQMERLQDVVTRADKLTAGIVAGKGNIGKIAANPQTGAGVSGELDQVTKAVQNGKGTLSMLMYHDPLAAQLESPTKRLNEIANALDTTFAKMGDFQKEVDLATAEFKALQAEMKTGNGALANLDKLQAEFDKLSVKVNGMMDRVNAGQGSIGQFLVNPQLNEALAATTRDLQEFAKSVKANPRKSIAIKIF
jgi:phospholipid/cholesterol/gamma-HCH transport system substrate-binding protein